MANRTPPVPFDLLERSRRMRHEATQPEWLLWELLRDRRLAGPKFRRQRPVSPCITDFYCHAKRLVVEVDGASHDDRGEQDVRRQRDLEQQGIRVLRVSNDDVLQDLEAVALAILRAAGVELD